MRTRIQNKFTRGVSRRGSREEPIKDGFWSLQNARLFTRGDTGVVSRIDGFDKFNSISVDYSNILDLISFEDKFVLFYEDDGTFRVDIYSQDGSRDTSLSYSGFATSIGSLEGADNTIFIAPHNKILYRNSGTWVIADYISNVPPITNIQTIDNSSQASGSIVVTGGASTYSGSKAVGAIKIRNNNVNRGDTDTFKVSVGGVETDDISVTYTDNIEDIRNKIYTALSGGTYDGVTYNQKAGIANDWEILKSLEGQQTRDFIYLRATSIGTTLNGTSIKIINSDTNIVNTRDDFQSLKVPEIEGWDNSLIERYESGGGGGLDNFNMTISITLPAGGEEAVNDVGPLRIYLDQFDIEVKTENVQNSDNYAGIGSKIYSALNGSPKVTGKYNVTNTNTGSQYQITLQAVRGGKRFNSSILADFNLRGGQLDYSDIFAATINDISGGLDSNLTGTLENDEDYWYKTRYKYLDGHITATSLAAHANSGAAENIRITIDTSHSDIDGNRPDVQVFRKKGGEDFYLVDTVTPSSDSTQYTDAGESRKDVLQERVNIWNKSAGAHTIAQNKYVRANVEFFDEDYGTPNFSVGTTNSSDDKTLPNGSLARVFIRPQYTDGTYGYHTQVGSADVSSHGKKLTLDQNASLSNPDKTIDRVGYYANFLSKAEEYTFRFNSPEIATPNIPTIGDTSFYPNKTRIFFGFRYIHVTDEGDLRVRVEGWDQGNTTWLAIKNRDGITFDPGDSDNPRTITMTMFGRKYTYLRKYVSEVDIDEFPIDYTGIYELDVYEALKDAIKTGELKLRIKQTEQELSNTISNDEILDVQAKVTGLIDKSEEYPEVSFASDLADRFMQPPPDTRLYLELEESRLDEIDNRNLNRYTLSRNLEDTASNPVDLATTDSTLSYEFVNFDRNSGASFEAYTSDGSGFDNGQLTRDKQHDYYSYEWTHSVFDLVNTSNVIDRDTLIYLGSKDNANDSQFTIELTGFHDDDSDSINFAYIDDYNIYEDLVEKQDINTEKRNFQNQIIWSEDLTTLEKFSGGRNIDYTNFFSISPTNGQILAVEELAGKLYAFCERGIAVCNLGEVLTQQKSGEVYVGTSEFITDYYWLTEKLSDIKRDSIQKHRGALFFTDGEDVYRLTNQIENVSRGDIPLDPSNSYAAKIDNEHYEYQLSDKTNSQTWVYNFEFGVWYGPFTYVVEKGDNYQDLSVSVVNGEIVEHGNGNTFDGTAYNTLIESSAFDDQESFIDKTWRKFYLNSENDTNATFGYGKDPGSMNTTDNDANALDLGSVHTKNGYKHIGIKGSEGNSKVIYWKITTQDNGFKLKDFAVGYNRRRRR